MKLALSVVLSLSAPIPILAAHELGSFWGIYNATTDPANPACLVKEGEAVSEDCCYQAAERLPHKVLAGNDTCFQLGSGLIPFSGCVGEGVYGYGEDCIGEGAPFVAKNAQECGCGFVIEGSGCFKANDLPDQQWFVYLDGEACNSNNTATTTHEEELEEEMPDMEIPEEDFMDEGMEEEEEETMQEEEDATLLPVPEEEDDMQETDPEMDDPAPLYDYFTLDSAFGGCIGFYDSNTEQAISRQGTSGTDELFLKQCRTNDDTLQWRWDMGRFRSKTDDSLCMQVGNSVVIDQGVSALTNRMGLFLKDCADGIKRDFQVFDEESFYINGGLSGPLFLEARPDLCVVHDGAEPIIGEARIMLLSCDVLGGDRALGWEADNPCTHGFGPVC